MKPQGQPITPAGMAALKARYDLLLGTERPAIVEIVSWAAGNGDRSENGDYLYPAAQIDRDRVFFGARVTIADEDDNQQTVTLVGDDEQDVAAGRIGWNSPLAKAMRGASVGDLKVVNLPAGTREWEVLAIAYD
jgi:transcription elongation factor GreB